MITIFYLKELINKILDHFGPYGECYCN